MNDSLIVFLRKPLLGRVKSRLAVDVGESKALSIYQWLIEKTKRIVYDFDARVCLYFDREEGEIEDWMKKHKVQIQKGQDLGQRMHEALDIEGEYSKKMILIGSDCPDLSKVIISQAFHLLNSNDAVLGPAQDGGIYLIALKKANASIFENVTWGSNRVYHEIKLNIKKLGLSNVSLEVLSDVDTIQDFRHYEREYNNYLAEHHVTERAGQ